MEKKNRGIAASGKSGSAYHRRMPKRGSLSGSRLGLSAILTGAICLTCAWAWALTARDYAIEITASVQEWPALITLNWRNNGDGLQFLAQRKAYGATQWEPGVLLPSNATFYVDSGVTPGVRYEYSVTQYPEPAYAVSGYICAGIKAPLVDARGRVILIVDNTYSADLGAELAQLQQDLVGDGWLVTRHDVARSQTSTQIRTLIQNDCWINPDTRTVFLFGHVAVPYSGDYNADDHSDHTGAWVADTYYADVDGVWTDTTVRDTRATRPQNRNVPGDGKFDQSVIPSPVELEVGRVDLANMPAFLPKTEEDLLRDYLDKDHNFRIGVINPQRRAILYDGFGESGGEAYAASGWRNFAPFFSSAEITEVGDNQFISTVGSQDYLWSYFAGGGDSNYMDCYGVGQTGDFAANSLQTVFTMFFGSYFGDWDATNCIFRAPLCSGTVLTTAWAGRPHWFFHPMAMGETIGYCARLTQNNNGLYLPTNFCREVHISLLGDPTLRMHVVPPPSSPVARCYPTAALLNWTASPDGSCIGYHVYRASSSDGPFTRLTDTPVGGPPYIDCPAAGSYVYMIRAIKLETSASGTYYNASQGIFSSVTVPPASDAPISLSAPQFSSGQMSFVCSGQIGQRLVVERSTNLLQWSQLLTNTLSSGSLLFKDANSPSAGCYYRCKAAQ